MIFSSPVVSRCELEDGTGWELKPEGACKGNVCIPLPIHDGEMVDIRRIAEAMALPLVSDEPHGLWSLGSDPMGQPMLPSARAPELVLPDQNGEPFLLSSLVGHKVVIVAWAPF